LQSALTKLSQKLSSPVEKVVKGLSTPGGYLGPSSASSYGLPVLTASVLQNIAYPLGGGRGITFTESGKVVPGTVLPAAEAQIPISTSPQPTTRLVSPTSIVPSVGTTPASITPSQLGGFTAPTPSITAPTPTRIEPSITPTTPSPGVGSGTTGLVGSRAPTPAAVPPPPVSVNVPTQALGRYEAMIRELARLAPGALIQQPIETASPFGPAPLRRRRLIET
jgi:hypothetical protein